MSAAVVSTSSFWFGKPETVTPDMILESASLVSASQDEVCSVCLENFSPKESMHAYQLPECSGHYLHHDCILSAFAHSARCPVCFSVYGTICGTQPQGTMSISLHPRDQFPLADEESDTYSIVYSFPNGTDAWYYGTHRRAFLPATDEGREVLVLLQRAWDARIIFTIGQSVTTGVENCVIWNGIHHKTNTHGGTSNFGFPDPTYLSRVKEELASAGIMHTQPE